MALPSQVERSHEMNRAVMGRGRSRGPNKRIMGAAVLLLIAGAALVVYKLMPDGSTAPAAAEAKEASPKPLPPAPKSLTPELASNVPATPTGTVPPAVDNGPAPVVLNQGRGGGLESSGKPRPVDVTGGAGNLGGVSTQQPYGNSGPQGGTPSGAGTPSGLGAQPPVQPSLSSSGSGPRALIEAGDRALGQNKLVQARVSYSRALAHPETSSADQETLRSKLGTINEDLLFSPRVASDDPLVETYTVVSGDSLEKIRRKRDLATDWRLIARVNRMANPNALRAGQKLKLVRGPFNVVVHKADYRLDLFAGSPDDEAGWVFIKSFKVGLGENNGTPLGTFVIKKNSKLVNPHWVNPKTGQKFDANDPMNPIGEFWLGWEGLGDSKVHTGFGLHGTIDPTSIGQSKSMGCVRMGNDDIALIYELLVEQISQVKVLPN